MGEIIDGLKLMVIGMGTVVVFLCIMIFCMNLLHRIIKPIETILDPPPPAPKKKARAQDNCDAARAAIAVLAIHNK